MQVFAGDDIDSRRGFPRPGGSYSAAVSDRLPRLILMIESAAGVEQLADWLRWGLASLDVYISGESVIQWPSRGKLGLRPQTRCVL